MTANVGEWKTRLLRIFLTETTLLSAVMSFGSMTDSVNLSILNGWYFSSNWVPCKPNGSIFKSIGKNFNITCTNRAQIQMSSVNRFIRQCRGYWYLLEKGVGFGWVVRVGSRLQTDVLAEDLADLAARGDRVFGHLGITVYLDKGRVEELSASIVEWVQLNAWRMNASAAALFQPWVPVVL
ncbi:hypothetical protein BC830DRAFT_1214593 [Chytriomyces sp. MP71]|nr:hypothetical protein BC830DRAFT_1214593 [Chytriomyces sp. MP71]